MKIPKKLSRKNLFIKRFLRNYNGSKIGPFSANSDLFDNVSSVVSDGHRTAQIRNLSTHFRKIKGSRDGCDRSSFLGFGHCEDAVSWTPPNGLSHTLSLSTGNGTCRIDPLRFRATDSEDRSFGKGIVVDETQPVSDYGLNLYFSKGMSSVINLIPPSLSFSARIHFNQLTLSGPS